ncbi:uncharacterized protein FOMMEDRAFT_21948 [Fomitiporia mediterranea MF3/22]|uniref:uncharacterized protein n=1 Tax=Fomitiporia mediterranea (strain MF3/22) TaxID=694068 RepID=UPI0004407A7B|nr:uncharacterized protein FOMMEDRAFT_21948 [Fomitiporia mediterranea MF3/22]EJD01589.1 hypothetical protein FOMMEDRAFT_21948 [Fomitiporia mediterranea MF3/22]
MRKCAVYALLILPSELRPAAVPELGMVFGDWFRGMDMECYVCDWTRIYAPCKPNVRENDQDPLHNNSIHMHAYMQICGYGLDTIGSGCTITVGV